MSNSLNAIHEVIFNQFYVIQFAWCVVCACVTLFFNFIWFSYLIWNANSVNEMKILERDKKWVNWNHINSKNGHWQNWLNTMENKKL